MSQAECAPLRLSEAVTPIPKIGSKRRMPDSGGFCNSNMNSSAQRAARAAAAAAEAILRSAKAREDPVPEPDLAES